MKYIIFFAVSFFINISYAQVPFANIAPSNGNAERVASFGVSDVSNDFLEITNSTKFSNSFIPSIWGHQQSDNRYVLRLFASTNSSQDIGNIPLMIFRVELRDALTLGAPSGNSFPWGSTFNSVSNRPLFGWENGFGQVMRLMANGNLGIGELNPESKLTVNGSIKSNASLSLADMNFMENVATIQNSSEKINQLEGKTFFWNVGANPEKDLENNLQYGLIAQEVEAVLPNLVSTSSEGTKSIKYENVIPLLVEALKEQSTRSDILYENVIPSLVEAIQEQNERNDSLQLQTDNLQTQLDSMQVRLEEIKSLLDSRLTDFIGLLPLLNSKIVRVFPTPSSDIININIFVEEGAQNAQLLIYDLKGFLLNTMTIVERNEEVSKTIQKNNFGTGTFILRLVVDGKNVDAEKVIFN